MREGRRAVGHEPFPDRLERNPNTQRFALREDDRVNFVNSVAH